MCDGPQDGRLTLGFVLSRTQRDPDRQKDMQRRDGPLILGRHPTVAPGRMRAGPRVLQRHGGGGGDQTDHRAVRFR
jgi:hypothetical protein